MCRFFGSENEANTADSNGNDDERRLDAGAGGGVRKALGSAEQREKNRFLGVEAVFGLFEDYGLGAVEDLVGDLGVAVGR